MRWIGDAPMTGSLDGGLDQVGAPFGRDLLRVLRALQNGDFSVRMASGHDGLSGQIAEAVNVIAAANQNIAEQLEHLGGDVVSGKGKDFLGGNIGRDGRMRQRIKLGLPGGWSKTEDRLNRLIDVVNTMVVQLADRAAELARSESRLRDSEDGRTLALAAGRMGSWEWDLATGACFWDTGQRQIFGVDAAAFERDVFERGVLAVALPQVRALIERGDWKMLCRQLKRARRNGGAWQLEFRVRRPDGGLRWCFGTAVAVRDAAGSISRIRGITMDVTERKESEDRQSLLAREVDHRTKNALAVVHAVVSLTRADGIQQFSAAVEGRLQALARAHSLLSDSCWHGAKIVDLVQGEMAAQRMIAPSGAAGRIRMSGRSLTLHPSTVQALAMALHELSANAVRHGALSVPSGSLQVTWEQCGDDLALRWTESGGPCPSAPMREGRIDDDPIQEGLGLRIVRASVETQLCGNIDFDWRPEGLVCVIRVPCRPKSEMFDNFLYSIRNHGRNPGSLAPANWRHMTRAAVTGRPRTR